MQRASFVAFSVLAYGLSLLTLLVLVGFLADLAILPRAIEHPASDFPRALALLIDLGLIALFGVQHSVMARPGFKAAWTRIMPAPIERSAYLVFSCMALWLLFSFWQPLDVRLWDMRGTWAGLILWTGFAAGLLLTLVSTFLLNHFELFGLAQAWRHGRQGTELRPRMRQPMIYRLIRHPIYTGFLMTFWCAPVMSLGRLVFASAMTLYVLIAVHYEERDLVSQFGPEYEAYRARVGKLLPRWR